MGPIQRTQVAALNEDLKSWYKGKKDIYKLQGKLEVSRMRTSSGFPKLKGKAAGTRHLSGYLVDLCTRYNTGSEHDSRRLAIASLLHRFYTILKEEGFFLSAAAKAEVAEIGPSLVMLYNALCVEAAAAGRKAWKFAPKFHMWVHLCEDQAQIINPRNFWCYADEDLVGQAIEVSQSVHTATVADTGLYKWLLLHFD